MADNIALTESTYYILLSLSSPKHGYGIMQNVETISNGRVHLAPGTLYGALTAMQEKRWIKLLPEKEGSRRKEYMLTEEGRAVLIAEVNRLQELYLNGKTILGGGESG